MPELKLTLQEWDFLRKALVRYRYFLDQKAHDGERDIIFCEDLVTKIDDHRAAHIVLPEGYQY